MRCVNLKPCNGVKRKAKEAGKGNREKRKEIEKGKESAPYPVNGRSKLSHLKKNLKGILSRDSRSLKKGQFINQKY